jgi:hypothetical protein
VSSRITPGLPRGCQSVRADRHGAPRRDGVRRGWSDGPGWSSATGCPFLVITSTSPLAATWPISPRQRALNWEALIVAATAHKPYTTHPNKFMTMVMTGVCLQCVSRGWRQAPERQG